MAAEWMTSVTHSDAVSMQAVEQLTTRV
eukprot:COSAG01_NODE_62886_length_282_cov_1.109290_1_plen_27_part_10